MIRTTIPQNLVTEMQKLPGVRYKGNAWNVPDNLAHHVYNILLPEYPRLAERPSKKSRCFYAKETRKT